MLATILLSVVTVLSEWFFAPEQQSNRMPDESSSVWKEVSVPHDWAISGPFSRENDLQHVVVVQNGEQQASYKTGRSGGLPWMGAAWYRCDVPIDTDEYEHFRLCFDGAMSHAKVWVNGRQLAQWHNGYNAFEVPISDLLPAEDMGDTLHIAVRLENQPESSRWYPGAGLYRTVKLIASSATHIPTWGVYVTTPYVTAEVASVMVDIRVEQPTEEMEVVSDICYHDSVVAQVRGTQGTVVVQKPHLWSPETPSIYKVRTRVYVREQIVDECETRLGIRSTIFAPGIGFVLNGEVRKFKGVCLHHDLGPLGAAVHPDAIRHQLTMLKDMGCDAIRTTHNMPCSELVSLCEEMGMMLIVESFDVWRYAKCKNDYSCYFDEWAQRDITHMVLHFRSSPAVVMWSVGNEVWDQVQPDGIATAQMLQEWCHQLDPTRPVTCGMDQVKDVMYNGFARVFDIPGFNYRTSRYVQAHAAMPNKLLLGSETASTVSSRGTYHFPVVLQPDAHHPDQQCSGYDVEYCAWSGLPDQDFQLMDDYPWTLGQFVWTGVDYLGEPSPYDTDAWPSHSSYFGIIDLASLPKDRYWLYRSQWNESSPTLHMLPHWTWHGREGQVTPVFVYTSYPEAELFVNGVSQGRLRFATAQEAERIRQGDTIAGVSLPPEVGSFTIPVWGTAPNPELMPRYRLMWQDVRYEPGEIRVVAYDSTGAVAAQQVCRTAGKPHHLEAQWVNRDEPTQEGLQYWTVRVVDKQGNLCPHASQMVSLTTDGTFMGAANGDPTCLLPLTQPKMPLFHGQCTFIVQSSHHLTFSAKGLKPLQLTY